MPDCEVTLVTGGTGTIGSHFLKMHQGNGVCVGHSEKRMKEFLQEKAQIPYHLCSIENRETVFNIFDKVRPKVVVHAAAIKHIDFAERNPTHAIETNVRGSLNVLAACRYFEVPIAVGVSTDKAAEPSSTYGYTKRLMEECFLEAGYAVCRFGNVAGSAGSVIPIWLRQKSEGKPLTITDPNMNRFMFTIEEAVELINKTIEECRDGKKSFILTKLMKFAKISELAKCISEKTEIVGIREGEKMDEVLFSADESERSTIDGDFAFIEERKTGQPKQSYTPSRAKKMRQAELEGLVKNVQTMIERR